MKKHWMYLAAGLLSQQITLAFCFDAFTVKAIRIEGLQRIKEETVHNYLPVHVGDEMVEAKTGEVVKALFETGFFQDISIDRDGSVLVIKVVERPTIGSITISGNKDIKTENLLSTLKNLGLAQGHVFDRASLELMRNELERLYFSNGKYSVKVEAKVENQPHNRVNITIDIDEGRAARIKSINIIGNSKFTEKELLKSFTLSQSNALSWVSRADQYDKQKLNADLEALRTFYFDRGYLNFRITSTQVSITPDKQDIFVTVNIEEGDQFTLSEFQFAGNTVLPPDKLLPLVPLNEGEIFSRAKVAEIVKHLTERLGQEGYAYAKVNPVPELNDAARSVKLTFYFEPGNVITVRRIIIEGNAKTKDQVVRREIIQGEGARVNTKLIEDSKTRLNRTGYFSNVKVDMQPVVGKPDQVDVVYNVEETNAGQLGGGIGYSDVDGLLFNANVTNRNFMGTGNSMDLSFMQSKAYTTYNLSYNNPYYTMDGISRGFNVFYSKTDLANTTPITPYITDVYGGTVSFGMPISPYDRLTYGFGYQSTDLRTKGVGYDPTQITNFIMQNGPTDSELNFNKSAEFALALGWSHNSFDRYLFPRNGLQQSLSANFTVPGSDLLYYKLNYNAQWYKSLGHDFIFTTLGTLGYGDGYGKTTDLPFYKNYFAGGTRTVRGFDENSLGPRDSLGNPFGGNFLVASQTTLILPNFFAPETKSIRYGVFFDVGQVYDLSHYTTTNASGLRCSTGISLTWMSPLAPLTLFYGIPLNNVEDVVVGQPPNQTIVRGDKLKQFGFTFGTVF